MFMENKLKILEESFAYDSAKHVFLVVERN